MNAPDTLSVEQREFLKAILLRRVNEAREALGKPTIAALNNDAHPNHCGRCVLALHIDGSTVLVTSLRFDSYMTTMDPMTAAGLVGEAWGTQAEQDGRGWVVELPGDLALATLAFDAGQIGELIDPLWNDLDNLGEPVEVAAVESLRSRAGD